MKKASLFLSILLLTALIFVQSNVVQTSVAAEESDVVDLPSTLADTKYSRVALMDKQTGIPQIDGKDMLFIDGEYFLSASQDEVDEVIRLLEKGMPVVFFGGGYDRLRQVVSLPHTESRIDGLSVSALVEGLAITPGKYVHGKPAVNMFRILGSKITDSVISQTYDFAIAAAAETQSISQSSTTPNFSQETSFETQTTGGFGNPGYGWEPTALLHMTTSSGDLFYPYGQLQSNRFYFISDHEVAPGEFTILQQQKTTAVPGSSPNLWNNSWKTADLWEELDARPFHINDWDPTPSRSISGEYTVGVSYYVEASWTGYLTNSYVDDYSNPYGGICNWHVDLPESNGTSAFDSGIVYGVPTDGFLGIQWITLQGNWAKWTPHFVFPFGWIYWYDYHTTPEWFEEDWYFW